jgi:hypothetical protein
MRKRRLLFGVTLIAVVVALAIGLTASARDFSGGTETAAGPKPSDFVARVDNPWFPLRPGTTYIYRGVNEDGKPARDVLTVTRRTTKIDGVPCIVVHDRYYVRGRLEERTTDWYTQDKSGNVWYYGEATAELDRSGRVLTTAGSWRAGRDGAKPGIFVPARPKVGQSFRQEYYKGQAEDHLQVLKLHVRVKTPYTSSRDAVLTREWTPLEPSIVAHKFYVRGIGIVRVETRGNKEFEELVAVRRPR